MEPARPIVPSTEPRQRWRVTFRRRADAPELSQRDYARAWESGILASGLPVVGRNLDVPKPRLVLAAPLAVGVPANGELLDIFLVERLPVREVRVRLLDHLPLGHELIELHDVWLGEPALSGQVVGADYAARIRVAWDTASPRPDLVDAARRLLAATHLPRARDKGGRSVAYDLRPLVADLQVSGSDEPERDVPAIEDRQDTDAPQRSALVHIRMRVRHDPERGVGRPEEVLAALAGLAGARLTFESLIRERLVLSRDA